MIVTTIPWHKQKTTWAGIAAIVAAVGGFTTGTLPAAAAIQMAVTGLIGIFLRQGIEKTK